MDNRRGRPRLGDKKKSRVLQVWLTEEERRQIEKAARSEHLSYSEYIRDRILTDEEEDS